MESMGVGLSWLTQSLDIAVDNTAALQVAAGHAEASTTSAQRTQYPLIKEYALNYRGLNIMN